jgi:hypothetical protein
MRGLAITAVTRRRPELTGFPWDDYPDLTGGDILDCATSSDVARCARVKQEQRARDTTARVNTEHQQRERERAKKKKRGLLGSIGHAVSSGLDTVAQPIGYAVELAGEAVSAAAPILQQAPVIGQAAGALDELGEGLHSAGTFVREHPAALLAAPYAAIAPTAEAIELGAANRIHDLDSARAELGHLSSSAGGTATARAEQLGDGIPIGQAQQLASSARELATSARQQLAQLGQAVPIGRAVQLSHDVQVTFEVPT